jgi:hypothetical protein
VRFPSALPKGVSFYTGNRKQKLFYQKAAQLQYRACARAHAAAASAVHRCAEATMTP